MSAAEVRAALIEALPPNTSLSGGSPELRHVYVPPSHIRALRLENALVIGGRGVGKSFWSAALRDDAIRAMLGASVLGLPRTKVFSGFGEQSEIASFPTPEAFGKLLRDGFGAYDVWQAVVGRWAAKLAGRADSLPTDKWENTAERVKSDPETFAVLLESANRTLDARDTNGLIVFDALDRASDDWATMDNIVRDLLRVVLKLMPFKRLHAKAFLREDQYDGRLVTTFPDASKLQANRVELTWAPHDLHGLLWQYLLNAEKPNGEILRQVCQATIGVTVAKDQSGVWQVPADAKRESEGQKHLFEALAGQYMGRDRRRGFTYSWSVGHLADARGRTSPRSFLAGIREAAEDSRERYPDHSLPLHYESIKRGVQKASAIRVNEMVEDYPWVKTALRPLEGQVVPCEFSVIEQRWRQDPGDAGVLRNPGKLPPEHVADSWPGVRKDLFALGVFEQMKDGRVNMPDLYRVGFGLGRRGGVKPMAKAPAQT